MNSPSQRLWGITKEREKKIWSESKGFDLAPGKANHPFVPTVTQTLQKSTQVAMENSGPDREERRDTQTRCRVILTANADVTAENAEGFYPPRTERNEGIHIFLQR